MENQITNCGLIALREISSLKDISVRTLINLAEDNDIKLFPYRVESHEIDRVLLPAIFYKDNHFVFVDNKEILKDFKNNPCVVLLTKKDTFWPLDHIEKIKGGTWIAAGVTAASAAYQIGSGIHQKNLARKLSKTNFVPPGLQMNKDLAMQQAFSRRSPGAAFAEEQSRRLQANQIAAGQRMFGGDANKMAAVTVGATQGAQDANSRINAQGQQFSENAFGRLSNSNQQLAQNDRVNQNQFIQTKAALNNAGNTNIFSGIQNGASTGLVALGAKGNVAAQKQIQMQNPSMYNSDPSQYDPNQFNPNLYYNQGTRRGYGGSQWGGWGNNGWSNNRFANQ